MENPIEMTDLGIPLFLETPICHGEWSAPVFHSKSAYSSSSLQTLSWGSNFWVEVDIPGNCWIWTLQIPSQITTRWCLEVRMWSSRYPKQLFIGSDLGATPKVLDQHIVGNLADGFKHFLCSSLVGVSWSNLTIILFRWVVQPPTSNAF